MLMITKQKNSAQDIQTSLKSQAKRGNDDDEENT